MPTPRRYGVLKLDYDTRVTMRDDDTRQMFHAYIAQSDEYRYNGEFSEDTAVIYADTEPQALTIAAQLSQRFPRNSYAVFNVSTVFYVPDSPAVKAKFSDKGLLPA